ncbi:Co/Zn/Cd efflux system component [Acinetobacter baylyi]|uniref:Co/Zn/Cd efflux system component n=1 Tax=Acinetobacter baylyi TaxID=202950 RepID=A0ABU0UXX4_ACIBI|nr:cation diffusion facilitator family transporter [Acinetobacter baylyi]MDQ1209128.1 Co/Zn/Cd efflux system component [Acinetobacter baylyi]MDR6107278.1 Co/Zn/Cd efflux system component [Acinetobacter baylyi]MDR6185998.1 Co/Zn/Cd efflux system component [Acinetobacter baylyi]
MAGCCHHHEPPKHQTSKFKIALWIALLLNLGMFFIEVFGGAHIGSTSLWADALDFLGDSINYIISIFALGMSLYWRATVALFKGLTMGLFALIVLGKVLWSYFYGIPPEAVTMGIIGLMGLIANVISALVLFAFRDGDANMKSVWLCSRNDAIGNLAIMLAALGVFGTHSIWPDLVVAFTMAFLGLSAAWTITQQSLRERHSEHTLQKIQGD